VIVGYDDDLKLWYLHDPSFGPALEVSYAEMDRMVQPEGRSAGALVPDDLEARVSARSRASQYRARGANELAAWEFVNGYAASGTGDLAEGERRFRAGLSIPDVSLGYRLLLTYELALSVANLGRSEEALGLARDAAHLVPDHSGPWHLMADLCRKTRDSKNVQLCSEAEGRWRSLDSDEAAHSRLAAVLPADFLINYLVPVRGWGGNPELAPATGLAKEVQSRVIPERSP